MLSKVMRKSLEWKWRLAEEDVSSVWEQLGALGVCLSREVKGRLFGAAAAPLSLALAKAVV